MLTSRVSHLSCLFESNGCYHIEQTVDTITLPSNMSNGLAILDNITF
jgi:hypothetical protein